MPGQPAAGFPITALTLIAARLSHRRPSPRSTCVTRQAIDAALSRAIEIGNSARPAGARVNQQGLRMAIRLARGWEAGKDPLRLRGHDRLGLGVPAGDRARHRRHGARRRLEMTSSPPVIRSGRRYGSPSLCLRAGAARAAGGARGRRGRGGIASQAAAVVIDAVDRYGRGDLVIADSSLCHRSPDGGRGWGLPVPHRDRRASASHRPKFRSRFLYLFIRSPAVRRRQSSTFARGGLATACDRRWQNPLGQDLPVLYL